MSPPLKPEPETGDSLLTTSDMAMLSSAFPDVDVPDTPAARNQNPGNLRGSNGKFRSFDTPEEGFRALVADIRTKQTGKSKHDVDGDSSIYDFFKVYAPEFENNTLNYAKTVAENLGVTIDTPIKDVRTRDLAEAIAAFEDRNYWDSIRPRIQQLKTRPQQQQSDTLSSSDSALLDMAFGSPAKTGAAALVDKMNEDDRVRRGITKEQQDEFIKSLSPSPVQLEPESVVGNLTPAQDVTAQQNRPETAAEIEGGSRQFSGEGRADFLRRTADERKLNSDIVAQYQAAHNTVSSREDEGWWGKLKKNLGNMRLLSGSNVVSFSQTPGGIDIGQVFRLGEQITAPTIGEALEGHPIQGFKNFLEIGGNFAKAMADPFVLQPAALIWNAASGEDYLLPEERNAYIRSTVANYAGLAVGYEMGRVVSGTRTAILTAGRESIEQIPTVELAALGRKNVLSGFRSRLWKGSIEGAAGGATTGVIEGHNPEESANLAVSYGLMALPFGLAFEALHAAKGHIVGDFTPATVDESVRSTARDMSYLRTLQATKDNAATRSVASVFALSTQQDLGNAMALVGLISEEPMIVSDIEGGVNRKLFENSDVSEFGALHHRPDGKTDMLLMRDLESEDVPSEATSRSQPMRQHGMRMGDIEPSGAHFSEPGASTYYDPDRPDAAFYEYPDAQIADVSDPATRTQLLTHQLSNTTDPAKQAEITELLNDTDVALTYKEVEELGLAESARALGNDGIRFFEQDDLEHPTTVNIWNVDKIKRISKDEALSPQTETFGGIAITHHPPKNTRFSKTFFAQTGFLPDQTVSFLGQDYTYRGPIFEKAQLTGHTIADAAGVEYEVPWNMLQRGSDVLVSPVEFDRHRAANALYKDFKQTVNQLFDPDGKLNPDAVPDQPFEKLIASYIEKRKLAPPDALALRDFLEERLANDLVRQSLSPTERASYQRLLRENAQNKAEHPHDLADMATSAGMLIERPGGSSIVIRDAETGEMLWGGPLTNQSIEHLILNSGRANGVNLDGNGAVPPSIGKGVMAAPPPPNGPHTAPYAFVQDGVLRRFSHWFNTATKGRYFTGIRQYMIGLDATLGTRFAAEVWYPNQVAFTRKFSLMRPDLEVAQKISEFARGMSKEELEHVTTLMETMAPEDMVKLGGLFRGRAFTDREISGAAWFVDNRIDIQKAFDYRRALMELERDYGDSPAINDAVRKLQAMMNVDERHVEAARVIGRVLDINTPGELSIYGITRLANAMMNGEVSPARYAELNELHKTPKVTKLADMIREQMDKLADKFDIPEETRLNGYFAHLRDYGDDIPVVNENGIPVFVSDLLRTGERDAYERDPINMLVRYTNSGYNARYTKDAWENASNYVDNTLRDLSRKGVIDRSDARVIRGMLKDNYLHDLRGIPGNSTKFAQNFFNKFLDRLGIKTSVDVRKDLVNTALSLSSSATIGFRPMQGIRDLQNFASIFYSRFGESRTADMLSIIARYKPEDLVAMGIISESFPGEGATSALHREGLIPTVGAIRVLTPEEQALTGLNARLSATRQAIQKTGELGIKWGLQHNVYQWAHAASFLEGYTRTLKTLNDMTQSELGGAAAKRAAYKKLKIDTYDPPVAQEFDRLVTAGNFEEAAKFMGHTNSFETVSVFGLANHPAGWASNTGRLLGQFGSWPVWARSQLMRMIGRGTMKNRVAAGARFAMSQGALKATSWAMGFNLSSWYLLPGAFGFRGGPLATSVLNELNYIGGDERQQSVVHSFTDLVNGDFSKSDGSFLARQFMLGIPGSYAARDIYEASQMAAQGVNPISAAARMFGVRSTGNPSMLNPYGVTQP